MRVIYLALKDLQQTLRDPKMLVLAILMPIAFTAFFGLLMGGQAQESAAQAQPLVAWADEDRSELSGQLRGLLVQAGAVGVEDMEPAAAAEALQAGRVAAVVTVPRGLGEAVRQGRPASLRLQTQDPDSSEAKIAASALQTAVARLAAAAQASRLSLRESAAWQPFAGDAEAHAYFMAGLARASELWATPPVSLRLTAEGEPAGDTPSAFAQTSPGMIVQFAVFSLMTGSITLVLERKNGALKRLLTTPISRGGIIAGKALAVFVLILGQSLLLLAVGQLVFGVNYLANPPAILALIVSLSLCMAGLGLLIGSLAPTEGTAVAATIVLMLVFAGMGGAWFPLETTGPTFAAVAHILPSAWAMDGFQSVLLRHAGLGGALGPAAVMLAYGAAFAALALWRFRFE